ncbi:MAG: hypothetical protein OEY43_10605, partial [Gammaproteobacteria bacterium]|nr:hypothetical protein [Gammaproteobacteria bacterium]
AAISYGKAVGESARVKQPELKLLLAIEKAEVAKKPVVDVGALLPAKTVMDKATAVTDDSVEQIKQQLQSWSRAWSVSDIDQYFAAYSKQFKPEAQGKDYTQWRNSRRVRLQKATDTRVALEKTAIYLDGSKLRAVVEFVQDYRSNTYHDRVLKQLLMAREGNSWLILSERVIQQLNGL